MTNYMYGGKILRIDLCDGKISEEPTASYSDAFLGGRGINAKLLYDEVLPEISPFDPPNLLIFGVGPMAGTPLSASRTEVTAKSPETGFLGSSNFGGGFGPQLKFAGYDNVVITGKADKPAYICIDNDQIEIRDANHLWGKDSYQTQEILRSEIDPEVKIACIGQAGENLVRFATVQHELGHGAGRTGMGAVMGSKNLKAIVVRGTKTIRLADTERYLALVEKLNKEMREHPIIQEKQKHGVSFKQEMFRLRGELKEKQRPILSCDLFTKYQPRRSGCLGCPVQCMDLYPADAKGGGVISCTLYLSPFYPVRNSDLDVLLECGLLAQRYGIDIVSSMNIISWLMNLYEKGLISAAETDGIPMEWGSKEAIIGTFRKIVYREGFGDILADGMLPAARKIGHGAEDYAYQVKGLPIYEVLVAEPKNVVPDKGAALCLAVSSRGDTMKNMIQALQEREIEIVSIIKKNVGDEKKAADFVEFAKNKVKQLTGSGNAILSAEYEGKPELVIYFEDIITICDCLSACKMCGSLLNSPFEQDIQAALLSAGTGVEISADKLFEVAGRVRTLERAFCVREGMTRETDSLPEHFMDKAIEQGDFQGAILETSRFEEMKSKYYKLRGWDVATGIPTRETLKCYGLEDVAQDLEKSGKLPRYNYFERKYSS